MLTAKMLKIEKKDLEDAHNFSKRVVALAAEENISMGSLLMAAKSIEEMAMEVVIGLNSSDEKDKICNCPKCTKLREEMN